MKNKLTCNSCGEEYKSGDRFCPGCGAKVGNSGKNKKEISKGSDSKIFTVSRTNVIQIVIVLVLFSFVNLFLSGVFDTPVASSNVTNNDADPHQGIDMSKMGEIKALEEKIAVNPRDFESFRHMLHLLKDSGLLQKTIDKYEEYIKLQPADIKTILEFAHFLHDNSRWAKAVEYYDKYIAIVPDNPDVLVDQGVCYFSQKDYKNAIKTMEQALKYDKSHLFANFNLGIVNLNAGNTEKGKEWMRKVITLGPGSEMAKQAQEIINNN